MKSSLLLLFLLFSYAFSTADTRLSLFYSSLADVTLPDSEDESQSIDCQCIVGSGSIDNYNSFRLGVEYDLIERSVFSTGIGLQLRYMNYSSSGEYSRNEVVVSPENPGESMAGTLNIDYTDTYTGIAPMLTAYSLYRPIESVIKKDAFGVFVSVSFGTLFRLEGEREVSGAYFVPDNNPNIYSVGFLDSEYESYQEDNLTMYMLEASFEFRSDLSFLFNNKSGISLATGANIAQSLTETIPEYDYSPTFLELYFGLVYEF